MRNFADLKITILKEKIKTIVDLKKSYPSLGHDPGLLNGSLGELIADYFILTGGDDTYWPADAGEPNIDGKGKKGRYSVKWWTPNLDTSDTSNKISLNDDLDFDWLVIVTTKSIYKVPRKKIVPPLKGGQGPLPKELREKAIEEGLIAYTQQSKEKFGITDSYRNLEILETHYKISENYFEN